MPDALATILDRLSYYHDDAGWNESDHPRDPDGKFSSTGGGAAGKAKPGTIPKIAPSQGKPYEHIFEAAHDPELSDTEKLEKINNLIAQFQNKYKGGYLKSISKYGDNVKAAMETGVWPGKKKGAVDEPAGETAPPAPAQKAGNKDFAKDGPKAAALFENSIKEQVDFWGTVSPSEMNNAQKAAWNAWQEIEGAKTLSDTPQQYKETLDQIGIDTGNSVSAFADDMKEYLSALQEEADLAASLAPKAPVETPAEKKSLDVQYEEILKAQLSGTEDKFKPEDVAAAGLLYNIKKIESGPGSDYAKAQLLNEADVAKLYNDNDELVGFAKEVADYLTNTMHQYKAKDAYAKMKSGDLGAPSAAAPASNTSPASAEEPPKGVFFSPIVDQYKNITKEYLTKKIPPGVKKEVTAQMSKIEVYVNQAKNGNMYAMNILSNMLPLTMPSKHSNAVYYCNNYLAKIKQEVASHKAIAAAAEPAKPAAIPAYKPEQMTETTKAAGEEVKKSLGLMQSEANKTTVQNHLKQIDDAFAKPTYQEQQEAFKSIAPVTENSYSMGIQNLNKYLGEIKKDFGVQDEPKTAAKQTPAQQIQANVIAPKEKTKVWHKLRKIFDDAHDTDKKGISENIIPSHDSKSWSSHVDTQTKAAFTTYTGNTYSSMNGALRNGDYLSPDLKAQIHRMDELFDEDFATVKQDMKVYRGEHVEQEEIDKWIKTLSNDLPLRYQKTGFISTRTIKGSGYASGANVQFEIAMPKGSKALNVKPISKHSSENEIMLPHGQAFEILEIEKKNNQYHVRMVAK